MRIEQADKEKIDEFLTNYKRHHLINCGYFTKKSFIGTPQDSCRFCGSTRVIGKFKNDSHLFPKLLGNRFLLSHFECDECNSLFKTYDDSLGKYLGIYRTISQTKGKSIPKFKDDSTGIQAMDDNGILNLIIPDRSLLERGFQSKELVLTATNQPHVPLNTYRAILKIAVSLLSPNEILLPNQVCEFLLDKLKIQNLESTELFKCCVDFLPAPMTVHNPIGVLYKRIKPDEFIPGYIFQLLYKQMSLQIFIPFHEYDAHIYSAKHTGRIPFAPIIVPLEVKNQFGPPLRKIENLNSLDKSIYNEMSITLKFDNIERRSKSC